MLQLVHMIIVCLCRKHGAFDNDFHFLLLFLVFSEQALTLAIVEPASVLMALFCSSDIPLTKVTQFLACMLVTPSASAPFLCFSSESIRSSLLQAVEKYSWSALCDSILPLLMIAPLGDACEFVGASFKKFAATDMPLQCFSSGFVDRLSSNLAYVTPVMLASMLSIMCEFNAMLPMRSVLSLLSIRYQPLTPAVAPPLYSYQPVLHFAYYSKYAMLAII